MENNVWTEVNEGMWMVCPNTFGHIVYVLNFYLQKHHRRRTTVKPQQYSLAMRWSHSPSQILAWQQLLHGPCKLVFTLPLFPKSETTHKLKPRYLNQEQAFVAFGIFRNKCVAKLSPMPSERVSLYVKTSRLFLKNIFCAGGGIWLLCLLTLLLCLDYGWLISSHAHT